MPTRAEIIAKAKQQYPETAGKLDEDTIVSSWVSEHPEDTPSAETSFKLMPFALRVLPATLTSEGGPIGALGAGAGETAAQIYEYLSGEPKTLRRSLGEIGAAAGIGAIPMAGAAKGVSALRAIGGQAAKGAALGVGSTTLEDVLAKGELPSAGELGVSAGVGGLLGAGGEALMQKIRKSLPTSIVGQAAGEVRKGLSPQTVSPAAQSAADIVRGAKGELSNLSTLERLKHVDSEKFFRKFTEDENVGNISSFERTGNFLLEPAAGYSDFYHQSMTEARDLLQQAYGDDRVGYVENYVRRAYKFGSPADEAKGTAYLTNKMNSLSAPTGPIKGRVLDVPLDEALSDMQMRGIKVKLASSNPEELRQWSLANARQAITYKQAWNDFTGNGLIHFIKTGERAPEDMVPLADRVATVFYPSEKGLVKGGQYYADENVARILNNTISRGWGDSASFRAARAANNSLNHIQLGLSGFHFTGTAINAGVGDLALGFEQLGRGDILEGAKSIGRSAIPFASFARDMYNGKSIIDGLKQGAPEAARFMEEKLSPAGGRLGLDARYRNQAWEKMRTAFTEGKLVSGTARIPLAIVEKVSAPLMEYAIPRVKLGAFADIAADIQRRMPNSTPQQLQREFAKAWDSIDNRFGQLVYDNLFWNKTAQDLAQISSRSVGWNLGTVRELGGGVMDVARGKMTDRVAYTAALPLYVGMIGSVYQYLHTGQRPQEWKDYFYPKNGLKDASGNPDRTTLPTYMKDVVAYAKHPLDTVLHKQSPLINFAIQIGRNRNYFDDMIYNPNAPTSKQWEQIGQAALKEVQPFSFQQYQKLSGEDADLARKVEAFTGFVKAPGSMVKSGAQQELEAAIPMRGPRTPEQAEIDNLKRQARQELTKGDSTTLRQLIQSGDVRNIQEFVKEARMPAMQRQLQRIPRKTKEELRKKGTIDELYKQYLAQQEK